LNIIVREAGGSVRDGLSLLDQIVSYCGDAVRTEDVVDILGLAGHQAVAELSAALLAGDIGGALETLDRTCAFGVDFKRFINDLLSWFRSLVVCGISRHPEQLLDLPEEEMNELLQCAGKYTPQTLILIFNALMENLEKAGYSSQPRFALEMALIKAVQAREVIPVTSILGRLDEILRNEAACSMPEGVETEGEKKKTSDPGPPGNGSQDTLNSGGDPETETSDAEHTGHVYADGDEETPYPEFPEEGLADDLSSAGNQQGQDQRVHVHDNRIVRQQWSDFIQYVQDRKPWMASALQMAKSAHLLEGELVIEYENSFNCRMLKNRENITLLTEFALDFFQGDFRIRFSVPDSAACDVDPTNGVKVQHDRQALANDSLVLTAIDIFNGEVGDIRVGPRFRGPLGEMQETENTSPPDDC